MKMGISAIYHVQECNWCSCDSQCDSRCATGWQVCFSTVSGHTGINILKGPTSRRYEPQSAYQQRRCLSTKKRNFTKKNGDTLYHLMHHPRFPKDRYVNIPTQAFTLRSYTGQCFFDCLRILLLTFLPLFSIEFATKFSTLEFCASGSVGSLHHCRTFKQWPNAKPKANQG